ncbi:carbohydrate kinase [Curtobacterium sp. A7_M15]|uniref:carbohydrate kinase family protein n=1 Tax=Curtobacterium sp. A7_M15 TaxID=3065241 RepID=UPI002737A746|nr:carbohydrate kinase [Curtobacterium sp. A7_M15]
MHDETTREIPGGSPANVALGLGRLGVPVEFATWLGDDARGHQIADHLEASGVELVPGVFGATRTSAATVRLAPDGQPSYEFGIEWDLPHLPDTPRWLHIGSIGAFLQPGAGKVRELVQRTAAAGGIVSFDPNIRPALLGDAVAERVRFEQLAADTTVLKLSDEDAAWLYPGDSADVVLDRLLELGVTLVAITTGAAGATLATTRERVAVPGERVDVVDTVGAGDTYMATLIWQLQDTIGTLDALDSIALKRLGQVSASAAAITVSRRGADLPTADDVLTALGEPTR